MEEKIINEENKINSSDIIDTAEDVVEIANVVEAEAEIAAEKDAPTVEVAESAEAATEEAEVAEAPVEESDNADVAESAAATEEGEAADEAESSAPAELSDEEYFEMTGLTPAQKKRREIWDKITTGILIFLMSSPFLILAFIFIWFIVNITSR